MGLEHKLKTVKNLEFFFAVGTGAYLAGYLTNLLHVSWFEKIDPYLGYLPSVVDKIIPIKIPASGREIPLGYMICAALCFFIYIVLNAKISPSIQEKIDEEEENAGVREYVEKKKQETAKERALVQQAQYKDAFYGLLELQLEYIDEYKKNTAELEKLRFQYYKLAVLKLKKQYPKVEFLVKDKIFFVCDNYSKMHSITADILKILYVIVKINKYNSIKVSTLFSYWVDSKSVSKMNVFRTLSQINALDIKNKIVIPSEVYMKIMSFGKLPWCEVKSLGEYRLFNAYNGQDTDVELYEISHIENKQDL